MPYKTVNLSWPKVIKIEVKKISRKKLCDGCSTGISKIKYGSNRRSCKVFIRLPTNLDGVKLDTINVKDVVSMCIVLVKV